MGNACSCNAETHTLADLLDNNNKQLAARWQWKMNLLLGGQRAPLITACVPDCITWLAGRIRSPDTPVPDFTCKLPTPGTGWTQSLILREVMLEVDVLREVLTGVWTQAPGAVFATDLLRLSDYLDDVMALFTNELLQPPAAAPPPPPPQQEEVVPAL